MLTYTYLADDKDYENFGPNQLAEYEVIIMYGFGSESLSNSAQTFIAANFATKWRDECLVVQLEKTTALPKDNFLKTICAPFHENRKGNRPFVGAMTINSDRYKSLFLKPEFREIKWTKKSPDEATILKAFENALDALLISACGDYLDTVVITPPIRSEGTLIPFGTKIAELEFASGKNKSRLESIDASMVRRAKKFNPVDANTLHRISAALSISYHEILIERVCPNPRGIKACRLAANLSEVQLSLTASPSHPELVHYVELSPVVREDVIRAIHRALNPLKRIQVHLIELIDVRRTEELKKAV